MWLENQEIAPESHVLRQRKFTKYFMFCHTNIVTEPSCISCKYVLCNFVHLTGLISAY